MHMAANMAVTPAPTTSPGAAAAAAAVVPWIWERAALLKDQDDDDSWETKAFAEDASSVTGGTWPPRSYACTFCRREFRSAQALGGHMNVHRRDRARLRQCSPPPSSPVSVTPSVTAPTVISPAAYPPGSVCFLYPVPATISSSITQDRSLFDNPSLFPPTSFVPLSLSANPIASLQSFPTILSSISSDPSNLSSFSSIGATAQPFTTSFSSTVAQGSPVFSAQSTSLSGFSERTKRETAIDITISQSRSDGSRKKFQKGAFQPYEPSCPKDDLQYHDQRHEILQNDVIKTVSDGAIDLELRLGRNIG